MDLNSNIIKLPDDLLPIVKKWDLDALGFVYECSVGMLHVFNSGGYQLWLVEGIGRVSTSPHLDSLEGQVGFKSRLKLLRLLVGLGCHQAIAMQRQQKINKLLP